MGRRIGQLVDQFNQAGDHAAVRGHGLVCGRDALINLLAQRGQGLQVKQHPGHQGQRSGGGALCEQALLMEQGEQAGFDGANRRERCLVFRLKSLPG